VVEAVLRWSNRGLSHAVEFLVVGGATLLLVPLAYWVRHAFGLDHAELVTSMLAFYAAHVINDPHFGVTYVLFYRRAVQRAFGGEFVGAQRVRYLFAGAVVPVGLLLWLVVAFRSTSAERLGQLIQLMFFLVSWHYVKQGFGVLTVLCLRRGIRFSSFERRVVLAHCFCAWAFAFVSPSGPSRELEESGVVYWSLAISPLLESATRALFFASGAMLGWTFYNKWKRDYSNVPWAPIVGFFVTIWLWSVYSSFDPLIAYVIPALHSIQYLYFVWLLQGNRTRAECDAHRDIGVDVSGRVAVRLLTLALSALVIGFLAFRGVPELLDGSLVLNDPGLRGGLGATPYLAAIGTFVNIHHYFMDNVIWRRENPETRYLTHAR
jgi:hypothetical protein